MNTGWLVMGRVYKDASEKETRYKIFNENIEQVESFNRVARTPYKLRVNRFADFTNEEFKTSRNRFKGHMCSPQTGPSRYENIATMCTVLYQI